jgi:hypothetical protein
MQMVDRLALFLSIFNFISFRAWQATVYIFANRPTVRTVCGARVGSVFSNMSPTDRQERHRHVMGVCRCKQNTWMLFISRHSRPKMTMYGRHMVLLRSTRSDNDLVMVMMGAGERSGAGHHGKSSPIFSQTMDSCRNWRFSRMLRQ